MPSINRLFNYVKYSKDLVLYYEKENRGKAISPEGFVDADLAGEPTKSRSTCSYVFHFNCTVFSWSSKLLATITTSTTKAEFMSLFYGAQQAAWLRNFYKELGYPLNNPVTIHCDSKPTITILKAEGNHTQSKHFQLKYNATWEHVERREIEVEYVETKSNHANILTKALLAPLTATAAENLGLQTLDSVLNPTPPEEESHFLDAQDESFTKEDMLALLGDDS